MRLRLISLVGLLGCATAAPPPNCPHGSVGLSLAEAETILADASRTLPHADVSDPLLQPRSLDDVLEILKRDEVDLFPAGVEFAGRQQGAQAQALQAQIELAWGEAQLMAADLLGAAQDADRAFLRRLEARNASGEIKPSEIDDLVKLRHARDKTADFRDALTRVAAEHVAKGAVLARRLIASAPDDYVGYRLAADYYRMRGNWSQFDEMLKKLETKNPTSNGLVFLRAMDEIQRAGRTASGQELLRQALQKDPKFVRAQSELVMAAGSLDERVKELKALEKLNPRHQLVLWVGPVLDAAYARDQKSKAADEPKDYDSGGPPPPT